MEIYVGLFVALGLIFLAAIFIDPARSLFKRYRHIRNLKKHGVSITAVITKVEKITDAEKEGNPRVLYYLSAQWKNPQNNLTYTFRSEALSSCPKRYQKGGNIQVLLLLKDPQFYHIDLPKRGY
jgi:hypothetical protein